MNEDRTMSFEELIERDGRLVYTNKGISMLPLLREGRDLMVIERKGPERCRRLDTVLFRRDGVSGRGAYVLHRIVKVNDDGTYFIAGDNCISGEIVREDQILGVLTAVVRDGRTIPADKKSYIIYSHLVGDFPRARFAALRARNLARCYASAIWHKIVRRRDPR